MQELSIPMCKKSGRKGRKPAWLKKDLLVELIFFSHSIKQNLEQTDGKYHGIWNEYSFW